MHLYSRLEGQWRRKGIWQITVFSSTNVSENHSASKMAAGSSVVVLLHWNTLRYILHIINPPPLPAPSSVWSHCGPSRCAEAMTTFSFFVTQTSNVPLLPVNKKYIILNYNPSPGVHNSLWCEQHNSATWKHFMYGTYTVSRIIIHSNGWPHKYIFKNK